MRTGAKSVDWQIESVNLHQSLFSRIAERHAKRNNLTRCNPSSLDSGYNAALISRLNSRDDLEDGLKPRSPSHSDSSRS